MGECQMIRSGIIRENFLSPSLFCSTRTEWLDKVN